MDTTTTSTSTDTGIKTYCGGTTRRGLPCPRVAVGRWGCFQHPDAGHRRAPTIQVRPRAVPEAAPESVSSTTLGKRPTDLINEERAKRASEYRFMRMHERLDSMDQLFESERARVASHLEAHGARHEALILEGDKFREAHQQMRDAQLEMSALHEKMCDEMNALHEKMRGDMSGIRDVLKRMREKMRSLNKTMRSLSVTQKKMCTA